MTQGYGAYVFRTKDPAIDKFRTLVEDHFGHRVNGKDLKHIHEEGGPSIAAMRGWFFGKTRRPQNPTLEAAGQALGYERVWQKKRTNGRGR
jgi:hypothetical protein